MIDSPSCSMVKRHGDGDLTINCHGNLLVVTAEGEIFQKITAEGEKNRCCRCECGDSWFDIIKEVANYLKENKERA